MIEQLLKEALNEYPPPSLKDIQERLGLKTTHFFYNHFPELSREIVLWHEDYYKKNYLKRMEDALVAELNNNDNPPSLKKVVREIKVTAMTLLKYFPELCNEIKLKRSHYLQERKIKNAEEIRQQIRQAALDLHEQGIKPNSNSVGKALGKPGLMRDKRAIASFYEVLRELGYKN